MGTGDTLMDTGDPTLMDTGDPTIIRGGTTAGGDDRAPRYTKRWFTAVSLMMRVDTVAVPTDHKEQRDGYTKNVVFAGEFRCDEGRRDGKSRPPRRQSGESRIR